jgi:hypothetical protein
MIYPHHHSSTGVKKVCESRRHELRRSQYSEIKNHKGASQAAVDQTCKKHIEFESQRRKTSEGL